MSINRSEILAYLVAHGASSVEKISADLRLSYRAIYANIIELKKVGLIKSKHLTDSEGTHLYVQLI